MTSPQLAEQVWRERLTYDVICLYAASAVLAATDAGKGVDLYVLAKVRGRYDFLRCETWPHGQMSSAVAALRMAAERSLVAAGVKTVTPQLDAVALQDATYDYVSEDLESLCDGPVKPARQWKAEKRRIQSEFEAAAKSPTP